MLQTNPGVIFSAVQQIAIQTRLHCPSIHGKMQPEQSMKYNHQW